MRRFGAAGVLLVIATATASLAAEPGPPILIAPDVYLLPGTFEPGRQPDGNTVILAAAEGLVVVDTGRHPEHSRRILDFAATTGKPIAAVINTHWHLDHVGGNPRLREAFPKLRVHASAAIDGALDGFLASYRKQLEGMLAAGAGDAEAQAGFRSEMALIDAGSALAPDEVVTAAGTRQLAGRAFELRLDLRAVTAGDVSVFDTATRVLVAGDLVTLPAPFLDTACPPGWLAALERLAKTEFAVLVPGHGPAMSRAEFEAYRRALSGFVACGRTEAATTACADGWLRDLGALVPEEGHDFARSLLDYYAALLRDDPERLAKLCGE